MATDARDVLEIARQTRPHLYDYSRRRPTPLVPRHLRLELDERVDARGDILRPLDLQELQELGRQLHALDVEAVAVCLLNGYRNPAHEQRVCEHLRNALGAVFVSASHQVLPEFREFERTATTVANAYVGPTMRRYIGALAAGLRELGIAVAPYTFHSNGGILSERLACDLPVRTCLSGPAAGVEAQDPADAARLEFQMVVIESLYTAGDYDGALRETRSGRIGVIGTQATIQ